MKLRFFSVPVLDGEAEARELNKFLATRRIVDIEKQLVHKETAAHWAVCVTYLGSNRAKAVRQLCYPEGVVQHSPGLRPRYPGSAVAALGCPVVDPGSVSAADVWGSFATPGWAEERLRRTFADEPGSWRESMPR